MKRNSPALIAVLLTLLLPSFALAQQTTPSEEPSGEMLEFLGSFEDLDVGWLDPFELLAMDGEELENGTDQENSHD